MDLKTYVTGKRGRAASLAREIAAHQSDVSAWADGKRPIPITFGRPIEDATNGLVTRIEMFPIEVIVRVWPELVDGSDSVKASDDTQPPVGRSSRKKRK